MMDLTEKWLLGAAGWKAMKGGREIFRRGVVGKVVRKGGVITGEIAGGGKPLRVTVRVLGEADVETVCPRMLCRRTGVICEHAVAVVLGEIHGCGEGDSGAGGAGGNGGERGGEQAGSSAPRMMNHVPPRAGLKHRSPDVRAVEVDLGPRFPEGLPEGGVSLKMGLVAGEVGGAGDVGVSRWVDEVCGGKVPPMAGLRGRRALDFLRALDGCGRVVAGGREVRVSCDGVRVPMKLVMDEGRVGISVCGSVLERGVCFYSDGELWAWDGDQGVMVVVDVSRVLSERQWVRVGQGLPVFVPMKSFVREMGAWEGIAFWTDDSVLSEIPVRVGVPEFEFLLEGSTERLSAKLVARYAPGVEVRLGVFGEVGVAFPVEDPRRDGVWVERNRDVEDDAAGVLMRYGFQIVDSEGGWQLGGDDAVIDFLTDALPELEERWRVSVGGKLRAVKGNLVRVRPRMEVSGSGEDWLAFDYGFSTDDGRDVPREVIEKMLRAGKKSGRTKNGKQVVISAFDAEMMESVLRDTDPRQEGGKYYVAANQGAFVRRVRDYYSGGEAAVPNRDVLERLPEGMKGVLRGYQEDGVAWLAERLDREGAALLADDMGLGKTVQTLAVLHLRKDLGKPALVVCPTSLLGNWADEAERWVPDMKVLVMHGGRRKDYFEVMGAADIIVTSYALVARDLGEYQKLDLGVVVLDEASVIRNPDTQAAKALRKLKSDGRLALSGTPVENAVRDLWSLYAFLLPGYLGSRADFKDRYEVALGGTQPDEHAMRRLRMRVEPFMIRRTKVEVAKDLPGKMEQVVFVEPSKKQRGVYGEILKRGSARVDELEGGASRMQMLTVLLRLRQASCDLRLLGEEMEGDLDVVSAKLVMLMELLEEARRGGHRVLVFSQFTKMLGFVRVALEEAGMSFAYLDGGTRDRAGEVKRFQAAGGPDVFLISLKAGGYGLNLTAADTVVHFDPWWNPAVEAQATDRAYRIGQTRPVTVYKLIAKGTVEEKILRLQERKRGLIGAAIGDEGAPLMTGLSEGEMRGLLG